LIVDQDFVV